MAIQCRADFLEPAFLCVQVQHAMTHTHHVRAGYLSPYDETHVRCRHSVVADERLYTRYCTGDAQISVGQLLRLAGAVIVTTPQDLALMDVRRGVTLFRTMQARQAPSSARRVTSSTCSRQPGTAAKQWILAPQADAGCQAAAEQQSDWWLLCQVM